MKREKLASRLGFLMLAAGSAVGLGNVWRFPYVAGRNGGAAFVLVYFAFLAILGFPLLAAELAIGRAANRSLSSALGELAPARFSRFWRRTGAVLSTGCFVLMIYYTDVAGWLLGYAAKTAAHGIPQDPAVAFAAFTADGAGCAGWMALAVASATLVCMAGVVKGVERATKAMMLALLALLAILAAKSLSLPGAGRGLEFYLMPDWAKFMEHPLSSIFEAMGQAFFTLSLGVGSMTICGSYVGSEHSLVKETALIIAIDTAVAVVSGLVVFPACASCNLPYEGGEGLIFVALPQVFAKMRFGAAWGFAFFLFLAFAALTTIVAVFEALISGVCELTRLGRPAASAAVGAAVAVLSLPCVFVPGVLGWEDFAVSQIYLPLGAIVQGFFVVNGSLGWGWENFRAAVSAGRGWNMPRWMKIHYAAAIPLLVAAILAAGLARKCGLWTD